MMFVENWGVAFTQSLQEVWYGVIGFVPTLLAALIIFAIGWILASLLENLVESLFKAFKVDSALKNAGLEDVVKRAGHNLNSGKFVGALVKWFVIVVFLIASFDILHLSEVNMFLNAVLSYIPQVIVAVLVLMVAVVVAEAVQKIVVASARAGHIRSAVLLGKIARWAIWIFAILAALDHLRIAPALVQALFTAVVYAAALAAGLAFGLGGKEVAGRMLEKTIHTVSDKE